MEIVQIGWLITLFYEMSIQVGFTGGYSEITLHLYLFSTNIYNLRHNIFQFQVKPSNSFVVVGWVKTSTMALPRDTW